jgi:hypothetical protein
MAVPLSLDDPKELLYAALDCLVARLQMDQPSRTARYHRQIHYIDSSLDQLQPKHSTHEYAKPGDAPTSHSRCS